MDLSAMNNVSKKSWGITNGIIYFIVSAILLTSALSLSAEPTRSESVPVYSYRVINTYPHERDAFTQGLVFYNGKLYESTGLNGRSTVRELNIKTGDVIKSHKLANRYFGEGITAVNGKIVQLTWRSGTGFVYEMNDLKPLGRFNYKGEGWGITFDGKHLIMSNGTAALQFLDPHTFETVGELEVYDKTGDVGKLNELEYVEGEIFANIWGKERIARIDPDTGRVTGWIELSGLLTQEDKKKRVDVLNGIAYDSENKRLFVTGKLWPKLFEIEIVSKTTGN
jgi:glutaminyl-peptide cyclotransferase